MADPMDPHGETVDELRADLERMLACLDKPVLDEVEELARLGADAVNEAVADIASIDQEDDL